MLGSQCLPLVIGGVVITRTMPNWLKNKQEVLKIFFEDFYLALTFLPLLGSTVVFQFFYS